MNRQVRLWAHDNAYTLIFLSLMFLVSWVLTIVTAYVV